MKTGADSQKTIEVDTWSGVELADGIGSVRVLHMMRYSRVDFGTAVFATPSVAEFLFP